MKKLLYILIIFMLSPIVVDASTQINTSFDDNKCILTISGEQTGHDATISLFDDKNELIGFKTNEIKNNNYSIDFVLAYDVDKKINITVSNENGTNEISKQNVNIPACQKEESNEKNKSYTITDNNGNSIDFKEEDNHTFNLNIFNFLGLTDEELEALEISKELYQTVFEKIKDITKEYGTLVGFYQIEVSDENNHLIHDGPFKLKIKMTDEMKKYNTFKLIYIDIDDNFKIEDPITLTINGDYLEGTINHLSTYALVGNNVQQNNLSTNKVVTPQTSDNIMVYVLSLGLSVIGITGTGIILKRQFD